MLQVSLDRPFAGTLLFVPVIRLHENLGFDEKLVRIGRARDPVDQAADGGQQRGQSHGLKPGALVKPARLTRRRFLACGLSQQPGCLFVRLRQRSSAGWRTTRPSNGHLDSGTPFGAHPLLDSLQRLGHHGGIERPMFRFLFHHLAD